MNGCVALLTNDKIIMVLLIVKVIEAAIAENFRILLILGHPNQWSRFTLCHKATHDSTLRCSILLRRAIHVHHRVVTAWVALTFLAWILGLLLSKVVNRGYYAILSLTHWLMSRWILFRQIWSVINAELRDNILSHSINRACLLRTEGLLLLTIIWVLVMRQVLQRSRWRLLLIRHRRSPWLILRPRIILLRTSNRRIDLLLLRLSWRTLENRLIVWLRREIDLIEFRLDVENIWLNLLHLLKNMHGSALWRLNLRA